MPRSLKIATILGVPVRVHYSWPVALILITVALGASISNDYSLPRELLAPYSIAATVALAIAASVLLHELAHVLIARRLGIQSSGITLFALGGISHLDDDETGTPRADIAVSIAGPLASLALGLVLAANSLLPNGLIDPAHIEYVALANIALGLFNLLPLFPLDGGRILSATLWAITSNRQRGIRIAALVGQLGAAAIIFYGAYNLFFGQLLIGAWLTAIGVFLMEAAVGARESRSAEETRAMS